jgi:hypothetical protein
LQHNIWVFAIDIAWDVWLKVAHVFFNLAVVDWIDLPVNLDLGFILAGQWLVGILSILNLLLDFFQVLLQNLDVLMLVMSG